MTDERDLTIRDILATPRPVEASFAALFPAPPLATYRLHFTGIGPAAGLHQSATMRAWSVGQALDQALELAGTPEVDGAEWTITAKRLQDEETA